MTRQTTYELTPHICRECFGRVLKAAGRPQGDDRGEGATSVYRCSNCGLEDRAESHKAICCCGIKLRSGADAGLRCMPAEPGETPLPAEIIARHERQAGWKGAT